MRGVVKARRHPRHGAGDLGSGGAEVSRSWSASVVGKTELTSGSPMSAGG
jgi:hypothetical protein